MRLIEKRFISPLIVVFILVFDQLTKHIASLYFNFTCNKGIAFGIGSGVIIIALFALIIVIWALFREKRAFVVFGYLLIVGGGASNIIDRVIIGCVRDFINILNFPSFNFADSAITIGALIIIYSLLKRRNEF